MIEDQNNHKPVYDGELLDGKLERDDRKGGIPLRHESA